MFAQIIPARRMPMSLQYLDYLAPAELLGQIQIGQLVKIPFRNKELFGVVFKLTEQSAAKNAKSIKEIIADSPIISKQQLNFLNDISEFYKTSLGFLLKTNLLPLQTRKLKSLSKITKNHGEQKRSAAKPSVFLYKNDSERINLFTKLISEADGQILLLAPERAYLENLKMLLPRDIIDQAVFITGELGNKEMFAKWLDIWIGAKKVIIGTRAALFLPWFNLSTIILDDESNQNYKSWDMAPRLHARDASIFLAKHHCAKLYLTGHTPSIESYYFSKNKIYDGNMEIPNLNANLQIIDLRDERRSGNYNFFSHQLADEFVKTDGDVFFFINRRGSSSYVGCRDCGNILKCPKCNRSLSYHQDTNQLVCHFDKYSEPMTASCKKCHGVNMAMLGAGTQLVETTVRHLLGSANKKPIIRIDGDQDGAEKSKPAGDKIIVGTQMAWPYLDWKKIALIVFVDADSSLFIPEYKISENLWCLIRSAQFNLSNQAKIMIQTGNPDHIIFRSLANPDLFYTEQLAERRAFGYPPFKFMVKLSYEKDAKHHNVFILRRHT